MDLEKLNLHIAKRLLLDERILLVLCESPYIFPRSLIIVLGDHVYESSIEVEEIFVFMPGRFKGIGDWQVRSYD